MSNTSFEEVVQKLRTLLEENAKVVVNVNSNNTTTITTKGGSFVLPQTPPNIISTKTSKFR